ncbi:carbohydrate ABC transporter permease [Cohnella hongkongensis]|uniref:Carbohydrate ABC transporter permease n=1 Tax=Cohnella hongkongensis TaxID=178337 RepID=A0ABV9FKR8_9BACL
MRATTTTGKKFVWSPLLIHLFFILLTVAMLLPFVMVIVISFTDEQSILQDGFRLWPERFSTLAYDYFLKTPDVILRAYGVTIAVCAIGTTLSLLLTSSLGYALSRRDYAYHRVTSFYVFFTMLFSGGLVPFYILMTQWLQLKDTIWAMIVPGLLSPFNVLIMKSFLAKIPTEIIESAKIDGGREWRIYAQIILPLSKPALATLGLFILFGYWNEWFNAMLFINDSNLMPLQLLLVNTLSSIDFITSRPEFMRAMITINTSQLPKMSVKFAVVVLSAGPMLLVFPFFQRFFVKGLTIGAIKS